MGGEEGEGVRQILPRGGREGVRPYLTLPAVRLGRWVLWRGMGLRSEIAVSKEVEETVRPCLTSSALRTGQVGFEKVYGVRGQTNVSEGVEERGLSLG